MNWFGIVLGLIQRKTFNHRKKREPCGLPKHRSINQCTAQNREIRHNLINKRREYLKMGVKTPNEQDCKNNL